MTTNADKNLYVQNSELYIYPTLTSDEIGTSAIFNNGNYTLSVRITSHLHSTSPDVTHIGMYDKEHDSVYRPFKWR